MPHIHTADGQFDFTVSGYLIHNNKTLLIKHKYLPIWTPPAGHIELHQTPEEALLAEIGEEAGIDDSHLEIVETNPATKNLPRGEAVVLPVPFDLEHHSITETHRHINLAYIVKSDTDEVNPGDGESKTFKWFTEEELKNFKDTNQSVINQALFALEYLK